MKKIFTSLLCGFTFAVSFSQWSPTTMQGEKLRPETQVKSYYSLNITQLRATLAHAPEVGSNAQPVIVTVPTLDGKLEKFKVYSFPVMVKSLADQYQLGSYVGQGVDDASKTIRFSTAPNEFQSMIVKNGVYEFIEPLNANKTVYGVFPKTHKTSNGKLFECTTSEPPLSKEQIDQFLASGKTFPNFANQTSKAFDKKYRTLRLAMSVNGEYTTYFGGVAQAIQAINNTMTRVNGVFEKDMTMRLIVQDFPALIYTNAATDPYSTMGNWNTELQTTLTNTIGNAAYDIGHMFGASGGGGNAGCIGCVCVDPTAAVPKGKGSGITSPADGIPSGDKFDIDYVIHEMGHQLGANHTFSHNTEGTGMNVEPGSGSTIMGYAGITSANVQMNSDPYFSIVSLIQMENNLNAKTCDIETAVTNNPPVITPMNDLTIPKGTAFVLTAQATDPEGDPMTYTWEQVDSGAAVTSTTGNNNTGPLFRSLLPTTNPTRYFPRFDKVMAGTLTAPDIWESVSNVARNTNFRVTVRDNNANVQQQQVAHSLQKIIVGADGPFKITSNKVYNNAPSPLNWDVANTTSAVYGVANVKIDYTTDNGATWTVLSASTPNDGTENFSFTSLATGTALKVRVSSIGNVFYAVAPVTVSTMVACDGSAPVGVAVSAISQTQATVSWDPVAGATYIVRYKKTTATTWTEVAVSTNTTTLSGLSEDSAYEVQVAAVCSGTTGTYTASSNFTTLGLVYCPMTPSTSSTLNKDEHISNVTVTPPGGNPAPMVSNSTQQFFTDYSGDATRLVTLVKGSTGNQISVTCTWPSTSDWAETYTAWIDFNRDGQFDDATEKILNITVPDPSAGNIGSQTQTASFNVPTTAYSGDSTTRMRVVLKYSTTPTNACTNFTFGEVEDYAVKILPTLGVNDASVKSVQIYPNPAVDVLNVTKVSNKATYTIHNMVGQVVAKGNVNSNKVNVAKLEKGAYVITVSEDGNTQTLKFIKK